MGAPHPRGQPGDPGRSFVVQEHHARALHWDFRLEHDGVLVSWALPKGVPEDPATNHLAVHTEDHPLEYGSFEGDIGKGEYGGGQVSIWDHGEYELEKWTDTEVKVVLHGSKARGRYVLFATGGKNWMIHRMDPPRAGFQPLPERVPPMLAVAGSLPARDEGWAYEVMWDGVRAVVYISGGRARAVSSNDEDITGSFPELREAGEKLGARPAILDGELVALGGDGRPSSGRLQQRLELSGRSQIIRGAREIPATYVAFDVLHLDGRSLLGLGYDERRELLESLGLSGGSLLTGDSFHGVAGADVLAAARQLGFEGVVAKRRDAPYRPGQRSDAWLTVRPGVAAKPKAAVEPEPAAKPKPAVKPKPGAVPREAAVKPKAAVRPEPAAKPKPKAAVPPEAAAKPKLTAKPKATVPPASAARSERIVADVDGRHLPLSNLGKVLYPASGFTKGAVLDYYSRVAAVMLPHVQDRPVTFRRFPDGVSGKSFVEKHVPSHAPDWIRTINVPSSGGGGWGREETPGGDVEYAVIDDRPSLIWAANLAAIEFHVPLWHAGRRGTLPGRPDHMVFDLDPGPDTSIVECCRVATWIADRLAGRGREPVAKTSGSKGMQVYVGLPARTEWDTARERALRIAQLIEKDHPELVVTNMKKALRRDRVLIDWNQNHPAKTTVAVYSLRGGADPAVSTPVTWDEVADCEQSGDPDRLRFGPGEVLDRVERHGDLFAPLA
jgi:bifunctional non-homologous end joining protein LigD